MVDGKVVDACFGQQRTSHSSSTIPGRDNDAIPVDVEGDEGERLQARKNGARVVTIINRVDCCRRPLRC